jgi:hypothetical protein
MPYIKLMKRVPMEVHLNGLATHLTNGGDMNYCFSMLCKHFIETFGESYANYSTCISSLECAKLELYRRKIAPYEDQKIEENGDI